MPIFHQFLSARLSNHGLHVHFQYENMRNTLLYHPSLISLPLFFHGYQEIVPLCCAIAIDIKFMTNLWDETWNSNTYMAANAGTDSTFVPFTVQPNVFGLYDDPYLIANKKTNPYLMYLTSETVKVTEDGVSAHIFL